MARFRTTDFILVVTLRAWGYSNCVTGRWRKRRKDADEGILCAQEDVHTRTLQKQLKRRLKRRNLEKLLRNVFLDAVNICCWDWLINKAALELIQEREIVFWNKMIVEEVRSHILNQIL